MLRVTADRPTDQHHAASPGNLDRQSGGNRGRGHVRHSGPCGLECELGRDPAGNQQAQPSTGRPASSAPPSTLSTALCRPMSSACAMSGEGAAGSISAAAWMPPVSLYRSPLANRALNRPRSSSSPGGIPRAGWASTVAGSARKVETAPHPEANTGRRPSACTAATLSAGHLGPETEVGRAGPQVDLVDGIDVALAVQPADRQLLQQVGRAHPGDGRACRSPRARRRPPRPRRARTCGRRASRVGPGQAIPVQSAYSVGSSMMRTRSSTSPAGSRAAMRRKTYAAMASQVGNVFP